MRDIQYCEPLEFIELIDRKFLEYAGKIDRLNIEWGIWSREMNLELRNRMEKYGHKSPVYSMIFSYWVLVSELLDLVSKYNNGIKKIIGKKKIENKSEEAKMMKARIGELFNESVECVPEDDMY